MKTKNKKLGKSEIANIGAKMIKAQLQHAYKPKSLLDDEIKLSNNLTGLINAMKEYDTQKKQQTTKEKLVKTFNQVISMMFYGIMLLIAGTNIYLFSQVKYVLPNSDFAYLLLLGNFLLFAVLSYNYFNGAIKEEIKYG